jgi:hypothetical protein
MRDTSLTDGNRGIEENQKLKIKRQNYIAKCKKEKAQD